MSETYTSEQSYDSEFEDDEIVQPFEQQSDGKY